jgi:hypothetical protein
MNVTLQDLGPGRRNICIATPTKKLKIEWPEGCSVLEALSFEELKARNEAAKLTSLANTLACAAKHWAL